MVQKDANGPHTNNISAAQEADGIEIVFYTDPLCCWSWAIRPQWQRFLSSLGGPVKVSYKMAGLLPSWKHFNDTVNSLSKPIQMGPEWMHARVISGVDIDDRIWIIDPPASPGIIEVILMTSSTCEDRSCKRPDEGVASSKSIHIKLS